jgi:hypothetical protein
LDVACIIRKEAFEVWSGLSKSDRFFLKSGRCKEIKVKVTAFLKSSQLRLTNPCLKPLKCCLGKVQSAELRLDCFMGGGGGVV